MQRLRAELGTADVRYLLVVERARTATARLRSSKRSIPRCRRWSHERRDRWLRRRGALRAERGDAAAASASSAGRSYVARCSAKPHGRHAVPGRVFEPFVQDVEHARPLPPLTRRELRDIAARSEHRPADLRSGRAATRARHLQRREGRRGAAGVRDDRRQQRAPARHRRTRRKRSSRAQRTRILWTPSGRGGAARRRDCGRVALAIARPARARADGAHDAASCWRRCAAAACRSICFI